MPDRAPDTVVIGVLFLDKPYNERHAGFFDPGGNTWWSIDLQADALIV
jgi:hypothetical protein